MQPRWCSLFLTHEPPERTATDVAAALRDALTAASYHLYDPFGLMPGPSYTQTVRAFVAPERDGWVRVIVEALPSDEVIRETANKGTCVAIDLTGDAATIAVYQAGERQDDWIAALTPHLAAGKTPNDLQAAINAPAATLLEDDTSGSLLGSDMLPEDVRDMAAGIDPKAFDKMFNRMSGKLLRKAGGSRDEADALLQGSRGLDWRTGHAARVVALMDALTTPDGWREPTFTELSSAYGLHRRRQRKPNARLYPGDQQAMDAVPDALDYTPVYAGRDEPA